MVTDEQLIDSLVNEWEWLCHDDPDPEDQTPEEYREQLQSYTREKLIAETGWDSEKELQEFVETRC